MALAWVLALVGLSSCATKGGDTAEGGAGSTAEEVEVVEDDAAEAPEASDAAEAPGESEEVVVPEAAESSEDSAHEQAIADAEASGRIVITGTLRIMTATELCALYEGVPEDMAEQFGGDESRYAVVLFDEPQMLEVMHSGDYGTPYEGEASMVAVAIDENNEWGHEGDMSLWEPYDGQVVTVSIDPVETLFPSDVRLPMGEPHTSTAELLFAQ